jgi:hypothetical protein
MIVAERTARLEAEARLANARAEAALIAYYKLEIDTNGSYSSLTHCVMAGLVPAVHVFDSAQLLRRGCPRQARA